MNNPKPVYLMAGGRGGNPSSTINIVRKVFQVIDKTSPIIAYIGVANGDNKVFYSFMSAMLKHAGKCNIKQVLLHSPKANGEKARDVIQKADAVFMSGGDVEEGMRILGERDILGFLRNVYNKGTLFFGASAGSIMMAKEWVHWKDPDDDSTAEIFPCLGLAPVLCDTHAENDNWEELKALIALEQDNTKGFGIVTGTCLEVHANGDIKAQGDSIPQFIKHAGKIEQIADISTT